MLSRYKIKPGSPIMTPIMSDTLFGHFCWAIKYEKGEHYLEKLLSLYKDGQQPPVLFSCAFVEGYLPRPALPAMTRKQMDQFIHKYFISDPDQLFPSFSEKRRRFEGASCLKQWNKNQLISVETWQALKDAYSEYALNQVFYDQFKQNPEMKHASTVTEVTSSNTISRIHGSVLEEGGGLFSREKTWFYPGTLLDLYVETSDDEYVDLVDWFLKENLSETGFGKDKSVGMGILEIKEDETFNSNFFDVSSPNSFLVLSLTSFKGMEKFRCFYRLKTKFGKLGGDFAISSPTGGNPRPFKKPILMMEPGSIFFTSDPIKNSELTGDIHSDERIRHCGLPIALPLRIKEGN